MVPFIVQKRYNLCDQVRARMFIEHLLWVRHCSKHFPHVNSFNLHNKPWEVDIMIIPILQVRKEVEKLAKGHIAEKGEAG